MSDRRSILLLCDESRQHAGNVLQHIEAFDRFSRHRIYKFNPVERAAAAASLDLAEFDVVAIHYTIFVLLDRYLPPALADKIARYDGLKIQFIQDEYRRVDAVTEKMHELGIDVLFTCVPEDQVGAVYGSRLPDVSTITTLPGFAPSELVGREVPPLASRPLDVCYRARDVPYWLGRLGREKVDIGRGFLADAERYGLRCDISWREEDRIYGDAWFRFVGSARATLGTESGASVIDFDGSIETRARDYLVAHPEASFEEVEERILAPYEGGPRINTAAPRLFEAAALRTALVLFPGHHSGAVEPWTHYIPLEKDFSNMAEVAERLRDDPFLTELTQRAHADLISSGTYSLETFVESVDELVDERVTGSAKPAKKGYARARIQRRVLALAGPSKLRVLAGKLAMPGVAAGLVVRDSPVRRIGVKWLLDRELRSSVPTSQVAGDLWKLAALRRVARGRVSYRVRAEVDPEARQVIFSSRRDESADGDAAAGASTDRLERIVWNHSAVGETVPLLGTGLLAVPLGRHGVAGAHSFEGIVRVGHKYPGLVRDALAPLVEPAHAAGK